MKQPTPDKSSEEKQPAAALKRRSPVLQQNTGGLQVPAEPRVAAIQQSPFVTSQRQVIQKMDRQPASSYESFSFGHHSDDESGEDEPEPQDAHQEQDAAEQEPPAHDGVPPPPPLQVDPVVGGQVLPPQDDQQHDQQDAPGPPHAPAADLSNDSDDDDDGPDLANMNPEQLFRYAQGELFPNLPADVALTFPEGNFNCHAWTVGVDHTILGAESNSRQTIRDRLPDYGKQVVQMQDDDFAEANAVFYGTGPDQILHSAKRAGALWSSKLGQGPIVQHTIDQLNGGGYGNAVQYAQITDAPEADD